HRYVPWSRKIIPGATIYDGKKVNLEDLLLENKDNFVVKPSVATGGEGVYIGRSASAEKWSELIHRAMKDKTWLAQEIVESTPALYRSGEDGSELHDMVWGFFIAGSRFTGSLLRVLPQKNNKGVINGHQGAKSSVVFHVDQ
ncbi:MAG: circularly permuted type 2 ATP-grasp protein, partial [bacterium]|nr:circularly permuted type 2 ATP-grasp protein [bacterium]